MNLILAVNDILKNKLLNLPKKAEISAKNENSKLIMQPHHLIDRKSDRPEVGLVS